MKITLTLDEDFADADSLLMFASKLKMIMSLPGEIFQRLAQLTPVNATGSPPPVVPPAAATNVTPAPLPEVREAAADPIPAPAPVVYETSVPSVPPADTKPRAKRGRPSKAETEGELPKANAGGAAGVAADVVVPSEAAPKAAIETAIAQGVSEAGEVESAKTVFSRYLATNGPKAVSVLRKFTQGKVREIDVSKLPQFLAELAEAIPLPVTG